MDISIRHHFAADPATVHAMMVDPEWLGEVALRSGATSHGVEVDGTGTVLHLDLPAPSLAAKFVGPTLSMDQHLHWSDAAADGSRTGTMRVVVQGAPADIAGEASLRPTGDGTTSVGFEGHITINVPFLGRKLEQQAEPYVLEALNQQQIVGNEWLARTAG